MLVQEKKEGHRKKAKNTGKSERVFEKKGIGNKPEKMISQTKFQYGGIYLAYSFFKRAGV